MEEAACKDFGARRDLTGISQFCKGNSSGSLKLEEFSEFRCKDPGIESQVVDSCPLLERLRRRSVYQEDRAKLRNLELQALHGQSPLGQSVCQGDQVMMRCGDDQHCLGFLKPVRSHSTPSRSKAPRHGTSPRSTPRGPCPRSQRLGRMER